MRKENRRRLLGRVAFLLAVLFSCTNARAQLAPQDFFYGRTDVKAPVIHPHRFAATCRWDNGTVGNSGTVVTCTTASSVSATQFYQDANITNWTITTSSQTFNVAGCGSPGFSGCSTAGYEAFAIDGTSTAMDWTPCATTNSTQCALHLVSVTTGTSPTFVFVGYASQSVAATAGFLRPAYVSVQTVTTPFGTGSHYVDPLGDWLFPITVNTLCTTGCGNTNDTKTSLGKTYAAILTTKYGSNTCTQAKYLTLDMLAAYVNTSSVDSDSTFGEVGCPASYKPLMQFNGLTLQQPDGFDLLDNRFGFASQPPIDLNSVIDTSPAIGEYHQNIDYFSVYWTNYLVNYWTTAGGAGTFTGKASQYGEPLIGEDTMSDTDDVNLVDSGQWWPDIDSALPGVDPGWIAAISPLHASFEQGTPTNLYTPFHMADDVNYEKKLSATPPAGCYMPFSYTSPFHVTYGKFGTSYPACSWGDLVRNYFDNSVANMKLASGSGGLGVTFDSFGSDETAVSSEAVCAAGTGAGQCGNAASVSYTLAHTNPTPMSLHIVVSISGTGSADVAGDCWIGVPKCASTASDSSKATFTGEAAYQGMIVSNKAWQANRWVPSGWVVVDGNGNYEVSKGYGETGSAAPTWSTTAGGNTADGTVSGGWTEFGPSITHGSTSTINYSTTSPGLLALAFNSVPPSTESVAVNYTYGGWNAGGCGLLDDDGASVCGNVGGTDVFGTNPVVTIAPAPWQASTAYGPFTNDCVAPVDAGKTCGAINTGVSGFWAMQVNTGGCISGTTQPTWAGPMGTEFDEGTGPCKWIVYTCVSGTGCSFSNAINAQPIAGLLIHLFNYERAYDYINPALSEHNKLWPDWLFAFADSWNVSLRKSYLQVAQQQGVNTAPVQGGEFFLCGANCGGNPQRTLPMDQYELAAFQSLWVGTYIIETYVGTEQNEQGDTCVTANSNCYTGSTAITSAATGYYTAMSGSLNLETNYPSLFSSWNFGGRGLGSALHDIQNNGWQLYKTYRDNRTDGLEDLSTASIACANGIGNVCGGEATGIGTLCSGSPCWVSPWGFNAWSGSTGLVAANELWLETVAKPTAPSKKSIFSMSLIAHSQKRARH